MPFLSDATLVDTDSTEPTSRWRPSGWVCADTRSLLPGIDQTLMEAMMAGLADKSRTVDGKHTSLIELGYNRIGMDDNWQACDAGKLKSPVA